LPSFQEIGRWVRREAVTSPNPDVRKTYDRSFGLYLDLYRATKGLMHQLGGY